MLFGRGGPGSGYERVVAVQRPEVGLRALVAIHSTRRGPAFGGIRRRRYGSEEAALAEALALAEAMSHKCALAELAAGGAKTVVLEGPEPPPRGWSAAYEALGEAIEALGGQYVCGPDIGTGPEQLCAVRRRCTHVNPEGNDAGRSTAQGVLAGLRAVWSALGLRDRSSCRVAIQGLGAVGSTLASMLRQEGVAVVGADPDAAACERAAALGVSIVSVAEILAQPCDVLSPCAVGGMLDAVTIERLRCRAVCGSANNQLATPQDAARLHARGILHAPDEVVSAGAVIEGVVTVQRGTSAEARREARERIDAIEGTLARVLDEAARFDRPPREVALQLARARLGA